MLILCLSYFITTVMYFSLNRQQFLQQILSLCQTSYFLRRPQNLTKSSPSIWQNYNHSNVKSTEKISSNFAAFWENINFSRMKKWENPTLHCAYFHRGGARRLKLENGSLTNELQWSCRWFIFLRKLSSCKPMHKKNCNLIHICSQTK